MSVSLDEEVTRSPLPRLLVATISCLAIGVGLYLGTAATHSPSQRLSVQPLVRPVPPLPQAAGAPHTAPNGFRLANFRAAPERSLQTASKEPFPLPYQTPAGTSQASPVVCCGEGVAERIHDQLSAGAKKCACCNQARNLSFAHCGSNCRAQPLHFFGVHPQPAVFSCAQWSPVGKLAILGTLGLALGAIAAWWNSAVNRQSGELAMLTTTGLSCASALQRSCMTRHLRRTICAGVGHL